ncbi:hypothetical protein EB796_007821 [Bugula neritina]|uniref:Uncharacterized protein n=1 Tax=Bugula neritina TaxID=10212 RepID=A0A7J7K5G4_BUGNE|nr:hypothetical protein EB796_007821 [Bugula neritina]
MPYSIRTTASHNELDRLGYRSNILHHDGAASKFLDPHLPYHRGVSYTSPHTAKAKTRCNSKPREFTEK